MFHERILQNAEFLREKAQAK